jgi:vancomycin resistance protein VanW
LRDMAREVRRAACQLRRLVTDCLCGYRRKFVRPDTSRAAEGAAFPARVSLQQPILTADYVEAKVHNIRLALKRVNNLLIPPGAIFSFWHVVGRPTRARGFVPGRSLLGGELRPDSGGGLCQLSGLMYYASLIVGLDILERHPHSRDIYDDLSRYAPLGGDATVAYGFKDLRVLNGFAFPVCFRVSATPAQVSCSVCSPELIEENQIEFARTGHVDGVSTVETRRHLRSGDGYRVLDVSSYQSLATSRRAEGSSAH